MRTQMDYSGLVSFCDSTLSSLVLAKERIECIIITRNILHQTLHVS
jgi:hypothetical protein